MDNSAPGNWTGPQVPVHGEPEKHEQVLVMDSDFQPLMCNSAKMDFFLVHLIPLMSNNPKTQKTSGVKLDISN